MLGVDGGERFQGFDPLLLALPYPHEDAAGERDLQLAGCADRLKAPRRMLGRRARVHGVHQPLGDRLEHQPLRGGDFAQPGEVLAREHAEVGVRQQAPLERAFAGPHDVGGEVLVAVLAQARGHLRVDLGALAGQHQQLLDLASGRAVEDLEDILGRVQMRLVGGERAVLAVAAAGPRQRQRQVAREGDATAHGHESRTPRAGADAEPAYARPARAFSSARPIVNGWLISVLTRPASELGSCATPS